MKPFYWLNKDSRQFLNRGYLLEGVTAEDRIKQIAEAFGNISQNQMWMEKFYNYMSRGWYSLSTPVWTNFGLDRGLPISCFSQYFDDSLEGIMESWSETAMMTKGGGGTSGYFGDLRPRGATIKNNGKSNGAISFMRVGETIMDVVSQGSSRRGRFAAYLPIEHGDFDEYMQLHSEGHPIREMSFGVTIGDEFMQAVIDGDRDSRIRLAKVIQKRDETGYPYILYRGNVDRGKPQVYKDKNLEIKQSNLCTEILEIANTDKSFTCCLSSMNLLHYDEWKDTDAVQVLTFFLDAVLSEFIHKTKDSKFMQKPRKFAIEHRSIGLGVLGYHSYLQSNRIPFESMRAKMLNNEIFKNINDRSLEASKYLAKLYGEPKMLVGYGERFTTRLAIAPTTSSSFILGQVSPSIEPLASNYFIKDLAKIKTTYKNPYLENLLEEKGMNNPDTWSSIRDRGGSVQHLNFLSTEEKLVFKTFGEISQKEILIQAATRQKYIDQSQSLNLMVPPNTSLKENTQLLIDAWKLGLKTLYYQRSSNMAQEVSRENLLSCISCE